MTVYEINIEYGTHEHFKIADDLNKEKKTIVCGSYVILVLFDFFKGI